MVCNCYEVVIGARTFHVIAREWHEALLKAIRHDTLKGEVNEPKMATFVRVGPGYDTVIEEDWQLCSIEERL